MAVRRPVPNFELSDPSDDEPEDQTKPKRTGKVTRVFDPDTQTFKRLRMRQNRKVISRVPSVNNIAGATVPNRKKNPKVNHVKQNSVELTPMDQEEERRLRAQINKDLRKKYKFIDDLQEQCEESGNQHLESLRKKNSPQKQIPKSQSPAPEPPIIHMTPTNRFGRKSFDYVSMKRKRSVGGDQEDLGNHKKQPKLSNSEERSLILETPENTINKFKFKGRDSNGRRGNEKSPNKWRNNNTERGFRGHSKNWKANGDKSPRGHAQFGKNMKTPVSNFKNKLNSSAGKFNNRKQDFPSNSRKHEKGNEKKTKYSSIAERTPEFMKVKDEDSVRQEKKERKRRRTVAMCKRTRRGQPVMRGRIELMLEKIKADLNIPS